MTARTQPARITEDPRWAQVAARDPSGDGVFWYSVKTTGVFCRPSCAARTPHPRNVAFHASVEDAERAGFRPCKRCLPTGPSRAEMRAAAVAQACRTLHHAPSTPVLRLAGAADMSASTFHRAFKKVTGVTPRQYAAAVRRGELRQALDRSESVTDAVFASGFSSTGRFYDHAGQSLGMTPSEWRKGGAGATIRFAVGTCTLGSILIATTERGVCALTLGDDPHALVRDLQDRFPKAELIGDDPAFEEHVARVVGWLDAPQRRLDLPLDVKGTAFQCRVWDALRKLPVGHTATYSEIAQAMGAPRSVRAVATACASNPVALAIPCHRVIRSDGSLAGYAWGIERKEALLELERTHR